MKRISLYIVVALLAAYAVNLALAGLGIGPHWEEHTSPDGSITYSCMYETEQDYIELKRQRFYAVEEGVHYHE